MMSPEVVDGAPRSPERARLETPTQDDDVPSFHRISSQTTPPSDPVNGSADSRHHYAHELPPGAGLHQALQDKGPPRFLYPQSSNSHLSGSSSESNDPNLAQSHSFVPEALPAVVDLSSSHDYRGVIDDLTIENRELKERLRRYETSYNEDLEKDRLFEVKIHTLPPRKRSELEETLRVFASSIDGSSLGSSTKISRTSTHRRYASFHPSSKTPSPSTTSNSRLFDSAYLSMATGATSTSTMTHASLEMRTGTPLEHEKKQKAQSSLHKNLGGLLPKQSIMTEKQKKKVVVRRLEELFTGKIRRRHGHPLSQEGACKSASGDQTADDKQTLVEGIREAHIWPYEMDVDGKETENVMQALSRNLTNTGVPDPTVPPSVISVEQRPTRAVDLDPGRVQIPSDNVEYLRHLGLPAPQLTAVDSASNAEGSSGWVYLNLLINMAQLHMINVSVDFVRSALTDVSSKFQLSDDGSQIRWMGGTEGTQLNSDSGDSEESQSLDNRDFIEESSRKRRKIDVARFAPVRVEEHEPMVPGESSGQSNLFHFKPLFHHRDLFEESESRSSPTDGSAAGSESKGLPVSGRKSRLGSSGRRRLDGPIVFYGGAQFCIDLSVDRGNILIPLHDNRTGMDGYSNDIENTLGCTRPTAVPSLPRTASGSFLTLRPFKDYSRGPVYLQTQETRARTPDLVTDDHSDLDCPFAWASNGSSPATPLLELSASGLGGTQPADHFVVRVETRRPKFNSSPKAAQSKFYCSEAHAQKMQSIIRTASRCSFREPGHKQSGENTAAGMTTQFVSVSPSPQPPLLTEDRPVKAEVISERTVPLEPSPLPAPMAYYEDLSSSGDDSEFTTSSLSGISHLRHGKALVQTPPISETPISENPISDFPGDDGYTGLVDDATEEDGDVNSDSSIDMLAYAREIDPTAIAARELEFDREADRRALERPRGASSAATQDGRSRYSSMGSRTGSEELDSMGGPMI